MDWSNIITLVSLLVGSTGIYGLYKARPENITYQTTESYNGIPIIKGSGIDTKGLVIGAVTNNYWKGIFYKLMLYSKTIDMLSINALKNLFALDILIDINHPIFKK